MTAAKFRVVLVAVLSTVVLLSVSPARAEGPNAIENLAGCATNTFPANDDDSTSAIPIGFSANFFGNTYTNLYVNNNGNVSFDSSIGEYTPFDFSVTGDPMIAPFLADVDTRGAGSGLVTYGQTTVDGNQAFCVNWVNVGYFGSHTDKLNSFQLLLVKQGTTGDFDIVFNYDKVQWETGDASGGSSGLGGTSAIVGFSSGDGDPSHFLFRDGSDSNGALLDSNFVTGLTHGNSSGAPLGRYVYPVRNNVPPTGSTLTGTVSYSGGGAVYDRVPVEICPASGHCITRLTDGSGVYRAVNLAAGAYTVTAHAPDYESYYDGKAGPIAVSGAVATFTQNVALGAAPNALPSGTTITSIGTSSDGIPIAYWDTQLVLNTSACSGGLSATYQIAVNGTVARSGSLTESPAGQYGAVVSALTPNHGLGRVTIAIDCPGATPDVNFSFGVFIEPSGYVHEAGSGIPVSGASVTLMRSYSSSGPFIPVPSGTALMSRGNHENPSTTGADGKFGWDVVAGYYKVRASASGYRSVDSAVFDMPPPPSSIDLQLTRQHSLYASTYGAGSGTVTSSPGGINCGSVCSSILDSGSLVTLTATAAPGSRFAGWSGGSCSGTGSCVVSLTGDTSVYATFNLVYSVSVSKQGTGSGTVTSVPAGLSCGGTCASTFDAGTSVALTATPAAGSTFTGWTGAGCSGSGSCTIVVSAAQSVSATFTKKSTPKPPSVGAPRTKIVKTIINASKRSARFKFSGSGGKGKLSFQCKLDKAKKFKSCRSGKTYKNLKLGKHTFRVRAKDARGKVDRTPATKKFKI
jgi:hypothetical protein